MVILLCYTSAFSEVIYADFYAKILHWNFRLVNENSQILVVSKLNFSFSFCFVYENCWIFVVVVVFVTKINLFSSTKIFVFVVVDEQKHCYPCPQAVFTGCGWCPECCLCSCTAYTGVKKRAMLDTLVTNMAGDHGCHFLTPVLTGHVHICSLWTRLMCTEP